jgi:acyl-CoA synthetase (AMP-forming)/AMP-acid ligase II
VTLRDHCRERGLSGYKIPKRVLPVTDMHRAPNGKADYTLLRTIATEELGSDT